MPDSALQDVIDFLKEYRVRVDHGRGPDPTWSRRKSEIFGRMEKRFAERGQVAEAEEAAAIAARAARRAELES